ncbi:MAG: RelA/SpoT family protein [Bacteroidales bacterium]
MNQLSYFTQEERELFLRQYKELAKLLSEAISYGERVRLRELVTQAIEAGCYKRTRNGINVLTRIMGTCLIMVNELSLKRRSTLSLLFFNPVKHKFITIEQLNLALDCDLAPIMKGLLKINSLYDKNPAIHSENFSKLLLTFSEDIRVVLIMIADRLYMLRSVMRYCEDESLRNVVISEASYLYVPLSHRLGLYRIKSEMEDLVLKYTQREVYGEIAKKLSETKVSRDAFIETFIAPIKEKVAQTNITFDIKGRTKSIHSILNKLRKQQIEFEKIYDLFAIRIIVDVPIEQEKSVCWNVYSIVTDMYQPNPKRMKDWISIPKSNGYESLHTTVLGPGGRWVEVQIRSKRMDEIAERGLAAHWKYKGGKSERGIDEWLNSMREVLESDSTTPMDVMQELKPEIVDNEIFVFTPKGDLHKLPKGATVLDFAFDIHTNLGCRCVGGKIGNRNVTIKHQLNSGDQVEILSSAQQTPKRDWLTFVKTSRARIKIKQSLQEEENKQAEFGKESLMRRMKNRKIEPDEATLMRLIKKRGFKTVTSFYAEIAAERLEVNQVIELYLELERREKEGAPVPEIRTTDGYYQPKPIADDHGSKDDVLVIDQDLKGIDYHLAKCCNPIYGDDVFGFVSINGGIKIHRESCPNAKEMHSRFGYRIVKARWTGKVGAQYPITLRVIGQDDIGIVSNITSIITKERNISLRSISLDTHAGLFEGQLTVMLDDTSTLEGLMKKIKTIKGVKDVTRGV